MLFFVRSFVILRLHIYHNHVNDYDGAKYNAADGKNLQHKAWQRDLVVMSKMLIYLQISAYCYYENHLVNLRGFFYLVPLKGVNQLWKSIKFEI